MNITKMSSVTQHPGESPGDYYERFCEAYHVYVPFDPVAPECQQMVNPSFVAQAAQISDENSRNWRALPDEYDSAVRGPQYSFHEQKFAAEREVKTKKEGHLSHSRTKEQKLLFFSSI